ncbi:uncharacterized protein GGS25DRAFT_519867 [Hypoxylon fragiforme]|uniref:uncharacterized protein n=1 Tax=Hypoxylon fragiforme TaxID=63214 RepID=UPI0020C7260F|nr:uncharacterized protein GGS25DRAFT_519867 [Hypoxylon fragiforme]KAI2611561.1 hypothetical protein GGS25DRAFT_519867 [Hypoxylon fragiforme]
MKSTFFLALVAGLASSIAAERHREPRRPQPASLSQFTSDIHPSLKLDAVNLKQLPESLADAGLSTRETDSSPLYECRNSSPAPADSDCNNVINEVLALDQPLILTANSCLLFQYGTCWGFFCSLCSQLSTDTTFVGNQLISAEALCVANGQAGTIVGVDAPQWQAGFVYQSKELPNYDVC